MHKRTYTFTFARTFVLHESTKSFHFWTTCHVIVYAHRERRCMNVRTLRPWLGLFSRRGAGWTSDHHERRVIGRRVKPARLGWPTAPNETGERTSHRRRRCIDVRTMFLEYTVNYHRIDEYSFAKHAQDVTRTYVGFSIRLEHLCEVTPLGPTAKNSRLVIRLPWAGALGLVDVSDETEKRTPHRRNENINVRTIFIEYASKANNTYECTFAKHARD